MSSLSKFIVKNFIGEDITGEKHDFSTYHYQNTKGHIAYHHDDDIISIIFKGNHKSFTLKFKIDDIKPFLVEKPKEKYYDFGVYTKSNSTAHLDGSIGYLKINDDLPLNVIF
jgi:hypothetical protein